MSEMAIVSRANRELFSLHPEEDVVEIPRHRRQVVYLETNFRVELPHLFVGANMGVYWVPGQYEEPWVGPDVLVSRDPLEKPPDRVYLVWEDGPLRFVAEVASDRTRRTERRKREQQYRIDLQVPEYLYIDHDRDQLELWRLREGAYHRVREEAARLHSQELNLWFGWDERENFVRIWTADGRMLLTKEEDLQRIDEAERRARETETYAHERVLAAQAERDEAREQARQAAARAAELEAELERLRRAAARDADGDPPSA